MSEQPCRSMNAAELERYLQLHIPISQAMGIAAREVSSSGIRLVAALQPNLNHLSTAFGGSVASLAVLAGWSLLRVQLDGTSPTPQIVIQRSSMEYPEPIQGDFEAFCPKPPQEVWQRFMSGFSRRGKARLALDVEVGSSGRVAARFHGSYVAARGDRGTSLAPAL